MEKVLASLLVDASRADCIAVKRFVAPNLKSTITVHSDRCDESIATCLLLV